jgi:hypothetical protein
MDVIVLILLLPSRDLLKVDKCWQDLLLNQFHDVLPGSCIEFAAQDAWTIYEDLFEVLRTLRKEYNIHLLKTGTGKKAIYSSLPWERTTVVFIRPDTDAPPTGANTQQVTLSSETFENQGEGRFRVPAAFTAALVKLNPCGFSEFAALAPAAGNSVIFTRNYTCIINVICEAIVRKQAQLNFCASVLYQLELGLTSDRTPMD